MSSRSKSLKKYWDNVRAISNRKKIPIQEARTVWKEESERRKKEEKERFIIPKKRIRKQQVLNFRRTRKEPYFISIRAITINPDISSRGLMLAVKEVANSLYKEYKLDTYHSYIGGEAVELGTNEDKILNDGKIHIEVFVHKNKIATYTR